MLVIYKDRKVKKKHKRPNSLLISIHISYYFLGQKQYYPRFTNYTSTPYFSFQNYINYQIFSHQWY